MRILNAFWEEKNLGIKTCEIVFNKGEDIGIYQNEIIESNYGHIVVKVPAGELLLVHGLEDLGFRYVEDQFIVTINPRDYRFMKTDIIRRFPDIAFSKVTEQKDIDAINLDVENGMFVHDRISMDPFFGKSKSLVRIQNWINELFDNADAEIYLLKKREQNIGFFVLEYSKENKVIITFAGLFNSYKNSGLAFFLVFYVMQLAVEKGVQFVEAVFSSNNRNMFNIISRTIRFRVENSYTVLRKII